MLFSKATLTGFRLPIRWLSSRAILCCKNSAMVRYGYSLSFSIRLLLQCTSTAIVSMIILPFPPRSRLCSSSTVHLLSFLRLGSGSIAGTLNDKQSPGELHGCMFLKDTIGMLSRSNRVLSLFNRSQNPHSFEFRKVRGKVRKRCKHLPPLGP